MSLVPLEINSIIITSFVQHFGFTVLLCKSIRNSSKFSHGCKMWMLTQPPARLLFANNTSGEDEGLWVGVG